MRYRDTFVRVNLGAIARNVVTLRQAVGGTPLLAVVKADAYGHGLVPVARTALESGAVMLGVAIPEEGQALREAGISSPILVLGGVNGKGAFASVKFDLIQTVYDAEGVYRLQTACTEQGKTVSVHLKLDTGMGRIGARNADEIEKVLMALKECPAVRLTGAFTHFSDADGATEDYSLMQLRQFEALSSLLPSGIIRHAAASAAMLRFQKARFDMVRAGIVMYGCKADNVPPVALEPALEWLSEVTYVKRLQKGQAVSYGRTFTADKDMRVATVAVGYGDGYHRALSGKGFVLIGGKRCAILGRVCMDQIIVDVTNVPAAKEGSPVVLIGKQGDEEITAEELAQWAETISYEMLLAPTARVPKEYINT